MSFSSVYLSTASYLFEWFILQALKKGTCFFCYCSSILITKLTVASGRSPGTQSHLHLNQHLIWNMYTLGCHLSAPSASTGNLQIASPKSWWCCPNSRWQFVFHRGSTPQSRAWNCKKSGHESTEPWREKLQGKKIRKKNVRARVLGHRALAKVHDEIIYIFMFFEHLFLKKSHILSGRSHRHSDRNMIVLLIFYHID